MPFITKAVDWIVCRRHRRRFQLCFALKLCDGGCGERVCARAATGCILRGAMIVNTSEHSCGNDVQIDLAVAASANVTV